MRKRVHYLLVLTLAAGLYACSKSNETDLGQTNNGNGAGGNNNPGSCDTVNMKYAANIVPILQANCYSCHGNGQKEGGVSLDNYDGVKNQADRGNLMGAITHAAGYPPMPQGGSKLSDCNINKIRNWVQRGSPNN